MFGGEVGSWKFVAEGIIRNAVPPIVVVCPTSPGGAFESGIRVGFATITKGVPLIVVVDSDPVGFACTGIFVEPGTAMKGVLLIIVKLPVKPGGALDSSTLVADGNTTKLVPPMLVVLRAGPFACGVGAARKVVGPTSKNGVLLIIVICAFVSWEGAFTKGMRVEDGITTKGDPFMNVTLPPRTASGVGAEPGVKVTGDVIINTGVPAIVAVCPWRPEGAAASGMVVGGITTLTAGVVFPPWTGVSAGGAVGQLPMI